MSREGSHRAVDACHCRTLRRNPGSPPVAAASDPEADPDDLRRPASAAKRIPRSRRPFAGHAHPLAAHDRRKPRTNRYPLERGSGNPEVHMGHGGSIDAAPIRVGSAFPRRSDRPSLAFRCRFQITDVRASGNPLQEVRPHGSIGPSKRICQDDRNGCDSQYCYCQRNERGTALHQRHRPRCRPCESNSLPEADVVCGQSTRSDHRCELPFAK